MTETAKIAANNAYQQNVAAADAAFAEGMSDLNNYVRTEQERLDDKAKAEQDAAYNEIMITIDSQSWNTTDELRKYLFGEGGQGGVAAGLSDSQRAQVQQRLDFYANNPEQIAADKKYNETYTVDESGNKSKKKYIATNDELKIGGILDKTTNGNNFLIVDGAGNEYKVELGKAVSDGVLPSDELAEIADEKIFEYEGNLYIKKGGVAYNVRGRGATENESTDYQKALALFGSGETVGISEDAKVTGVINAAITGNNFKIGGYKVELGTLVDPATLPSDTHGKTKDGSVFVHNGQLYYRMDGVYGTQYYTVQGRGGKNTDDYQKALALFTNK